MSRSLSYLVKIRINPFSETYEEDFEESCGNERTANVLTGIAVRARTYHVRLPATNLDEQSHRTDRQRRLYSPLFYTIKCYLEIEEVFDIMKYCFEYGGASGGDWHV